MDEFPDPEDEFDLLHEDEYEILRELQASETQKTVTKDLCKSNSINNGIQPENNKNISNTLVKQNTKLEVTDRIKNHYNQSLENVNTKKRTIDQIMEDAQLYSEDIDFHEKRPCWDQPEDLIKIILEKKRELYKYGIKNTFEKCTIHKNNSDSISRRVPTWNFIAVTRNDDGERFYIKVLNSNKYIPKNHHSKLRCLLKSFNQLKDEANQIILQKAEMANIEKYKFIQSSNKQSYTGELWVDKYRPKCYIDLLSDENVNRSLLYWMKLWDKIVFDRDSTIRIRKPQTLSKYKNKYKNKFNLKEEVPDHDSKGFPSYRVALITGPPGLGKTTLAHIVAKHAGYNIVELNASDDRGTEAFREALLASTQMKSVIDKDKRPNCLILDEIDGAPSSSIELLLKFIQGKLIPKGKNVKNVSNHKEENHGCRRPIICICNDLYTPSLRPLRTVALVINVPEITSARLANRLAEICRKENLKVDSRVLIQLAERSACDIRACLGILQYTGGGTEMLKNLAFGLKDMRKNLFESWKEMLQIPMTANGLLSISERATKVVKIVHQSESDRLMQGIFHNYPETCNEQLIPIYKSLRWFEFYDEINTQVMQHQSWILMPYSTWAFVAWHLYLASKKVPKVSFPTTALEVIQKLERNKSVLTIVKRTSKIDILTLVSDVLPFFPSILSPPLHSGNFQLLSAKEKLDMQNLVNIMLDFGLTFIQEKKAQGGYEYIFEPDIWQVATFPNCEMKKPLAQTVKQLAIQELGKTRLQRSAVISGEQVKCPTSKSSAQTTASQSTSKANENVPNHLRHLNPIEVAPTKEKKCRNFFRSFQLAGQEKLKEKLAREKEEGIVNTSSEEKAESVKAAKKQSDLLKSDVWYQYKEGYSNAVRRNILMKDLF